MKKVYLVHCWDGTIEDGWYPWLKQHLENNNIEVIMENMPNTEEPRINEWVPKLDSLVSKLDEDTYFIGHSIGCQTIMRYLETKGITKIGGILFVAPWLDLLPPALEDGADEIADEWINTSIDFEKIKQFTNNINAIFSTNDYFVSLEQEKEFKNKLGTNTIIVENKGHISAADDVNELAEILINIGKMMNLELLDIVDEKGNKTGLIVDKDLAHNQNLLHNEVGLFIFNSKNELLIQKRSPNKKYNPNKWGLCAGHVDIYEDLVTACIREAKEEIGIEIEEKNLNYLMTIIKKMETICRYNVFYIFLDCDIENFVIQKEELSEVKWIDFIEYKNKVIDNSPELTWNNTEVNMKVLTIFEEILKGRK